MNTTCLRDRDAMGAFPYAAKFDEVQPWGEHRIANDAGPGYMGGTVWGLPQVTEGEERFRQRALRSSEWREPSLAPAQESSSRSLPIRSGAIPNPASNKVTCIAATLQKRAGEERIGVGKGPAARLMMKDYQRQTEFLRQCIRYNDTAEHRHLEARITELQRDDICVRRAVWLMALLAALAMAGLCYAIIFLTDNPPNLANLAVISERFFIKALCALGMGSMICLLAFLGLGLTYRKELDQRREACRRLAKEFLESRLGTSVAASRRDHSAFNEQGKFDGHQLPVEPPPPVRLPDTAAN